LVRRIGGDGHLISDFPESWPSPAGCPASAATAAAAERLQIFHSGLGWFPPWAADDSNRFGNVLLHDFRHFFGVGIDELDRPRLGAMRTSSGLSF